MAARHVTFHRSIHAFRSVHVILQSNSSNLTRSIILPFCCHLPLVHGTAPMEPGGSLIPCSSAAQRSTDKPVTTQNCTVRPTCDCGTLRPSVDGLGSSQTFIVMSRHASIATTHRKLSPIRTRHRLRVANLWPHSMQYDLALQPRTNTLLLLKRNAH